MGFGITSVCNSSTYCGFVGSKISKNDFETNIWFCKYKITVSALSEENQASCELQILKKICLPAEEIEACQISG